MTPEQARADDDNRPCSCHPDIALTPCPKQHASWHCQHEAVLRGTHVIVPAMAEADERKAVVEWLRGVHTRLSDWGDFDYGYKLAHQEILEAIERGEHLKKDQE